LITSKGIAVAVEGDGGGFGLSNELGDLLKRRAVANDESAADGAEIAVERFQAFAEELLARRACPVVVIFPRAEDVEGNHFVGVFRGVMQPGVVSDAKILAKPMDDAVVV